MSETYTQRLLDLPWRNKGIQGSRAGYALTRHLYSKYGSATVRDAWNLFTETANKGQTILIRMYGPTMYAITREMFSELGLELPQEIKLSPISMSREMPHAEEKLLQAISQFPIGEEFTTLDLTEITGYTQKSINHYLNKRRRKELGIEEGRQLPWDVKDSKRYPVKVLRRVQKVS